MSLPQVLCSFATERQCSHHMNAFLFTKSLDHVHSNFLACYTPLPPCAGSKGDDSSDDIREEECDYGEWESTPKLAQQLSTLPDAPPRDEQEDPSAEEEEQPEARTLAVLVLCAERAAARQGGACLRRCLDLERARVSLG